MKQRIITGFLMILAVAVVFFLRIQYSEYFFDILIGAVTIFSALEIANLLYEAGKHNVILASVVYPAISYATTLICINAKLDWWIIILIQLGIIVLFLLCLFAFFMIDKKYTIAEMHYNKYTGSLLSYSSLKCLHTLYSFLYPSCMLLCMVFINHANDMGYMFSSISTNFSGIDLGLILLLITILSSCTSDTMGLYFGILFGKRKLAPKISPNKTIAGAVGSLIVVPIVCALFYVLATTQANILKAFNAVNINIWTFIIYGILSSIVSQAGDLFESYLKRKANVKDSGNVFPGHGGFMDRIDALTFNIFFTMIFFAIIL
jgi:phosphatidate cytidylyltransferase